MPWHCVAHGHMGWPACLDRLAAHELAHAPSALYMRTALVARRRRAMASGAGRRNGCSSKGTLVWCLSLTEGGGELHQHDVGRGGRRCLGSEASAATRHLLLRRAPAVLLMEGGGQWRRWLTVVERWHSRVCTRWLRLDVQRGSDGGAVGPA
jgi:hypothetical protein